nr:regulatory component of sensory transduction system [Cyanidiaceae sp.]
MMNTKQKKNQHHLLIVDDENSIRKILQTRLTLLGYSVSTACNGEEALKIFTTNPIDLIVLDIMMPKLDGYGVCQEIRKESNIPIIMLTALGDVLDKVTGLELGADDYVIKPFSPRELEARIQSILRRIQTRNARIKPYNDVNLFKIGSLNIDLEKKQIYKNHELIRLTEMEFSLLELLISQSGKAFSRSKILKEVWGYKSSKHESIADTRIVDVHISRLRAKLEDDPTNPGLILTARGTGYLCRKLIV